MKKILVALDGSPRAPSVFAAASTLAAKFGAELTLLQAVGIPAHLPSEALGMAPGELGEFLRGNALKYLRGFEGAAGAPAGLRVRAEIGTPWRTICAVADEEHTDLIVLGSHGYDAVDRFLGTTAAKVVNHASVSVHVVRAPQPAL